MGLRLSQWSFCIQHYRLNTYSLAGSFGRDQGRIRCLLPPQFICVGFDLSLWKGFVEKARHVWVPHISNKSKKLRMETLNLKHIVDLIHIWIPPLILLHKRSGRKSRSIFPFRGKRLCKLAPFHASFEVAKTSHHVRTIHQFLMVVIKIRPCF